MSIELSICLFQTVSLFVLLSIYLATEVTLSTRAASFPTGGRGNPKQIDRQQSRKQRAGTSGLDRERDE